MRAVIADATAGTQAGGTTVLSSSGGGGGGGGGGGAFFGPHQPLLRQMTPGLQGWRATPLDVTQDHLFSPNFGSLGPHYPTSVGSLVVGSDDSWVVGPEGLFWLNVQRQDDPVWTGGAPVSKEFVLNWKFLIADEDCAWAGPLVDSSCDEYGLLFFCSDEWDSPGFIGTRYFTMCWTPTFGLSRYGDMLYDWWVLEDYLATEGAIRTTEGVGGSITGAFGVPGAPAYLQLAPNAGEAGFVPLTWAPSNQSTTLQKRNGNYVLCSLTFVTPIFLWELTEYDATGAVVQTLVVADRGHDSHAVGNCHAILGPPGSGMIYLPISTGNASSPYWSTFAAIDYESWVDTGNWAGATWSSTDGYDPIYQFDAHRGFVSDTRIVTVQTPFSGGTSDRAVVYYWDADGTEGVLGVLNSTNIPDFEPSIEVWPTPNGKLLVTQFSRTFSGGSLIDGKTTFYELDAFSPIPMSAQVPFATLEDPYPDASVNRPFWESIFTSVRVDSRYVSINAVVPCIIKGTPVTPHNVEDPPAPVTPPASPVPANVLWENAQVISGTSGSVSGDFSNVTPGSPAQAEYPNRGVPEPTLWYRFDSQGHRGWAYFWLSLPGGGGTGNYPTSLISIPTANDVGDFT